MSKIFCSKNLALNVSLALSGKGIGEVLVWNIFLSNYIEVLWNIFVPV